MTDQINKTPSNQALSTQEKLNLETAIMEWKELEICFAQGKLLIVDPSCDLIKVAAQISDSELNNIQKLIDENLLQFASPSWIKQHCQSNTLLWTLVVAPYVLSQLKVE